MKTLNFTLTSGKAGYRSGFALKKAVACLALALCFAGCKKDAAEQPSDATASAKSGKAGTSVADFTIAVIPDTQYYVSSQNGGTPAMFTSQIDWIKANQVAENIVYVASLGDITDHGNTYASEWTNASTNGYYKLESQAGFTNGIPYGTCVGNHDQTPNTGHPLTCSTSSYNGKFGANRFRPRAYYGEAYAGSASNNNDSHYDLISAGGIDFIIFYVEYDSHGDDSAVNTWVYNTLGTYASRKAIIVSHMVINASGAWGTTGSSYAQGQVLYNRVRSRNNVFMMLGGHYTGESYREETYNGYVTRIFMSDYQGRTNGGNGYMRLMKFSPDNNLISVKTYSPHLGTYETDANSQFTKPMFGKADFDDFANGTGHFYRAPTYSGSTVGIATTSTATHYVSGSSTHLKLTLNDNTGVTTPWFIRLLSGDGVALNNTPTPKTDSLYFWLKTSNAQAGATARIWVDDSDGTEQSSSINIINDGAWHKYAWNLPTYGGVGAVGGNGIIDKAQVTLDAIILAQPNTATQWVAYIDDVGKQ